MMLVCPKCNNTQETGKFCGVCGTATESSYNQVEQNTANSSQASVPLKQPEIPVQAQAVTQQQPAAAVEQAYTNTQQTTEVAKQALGNYWNYFLQLLKNPSRAFQHSENQFIYGLVTMAIYAIAFSLSIYFLANSFVNTAVNPITGMFGGESVSLPFFATNFSITLLNVIFIAIAFFSAFIVTKLAKSRLNFKTYIAQFGGLMVPFAALNIISILGGLIRSPELTMFPLLLSYLFTFIFIPVLFSYEKVGQVNNQNQKVYFSLLTIILVAIFTYILGKALLFNLLDGLSSLIGNLW